MKRPAQKKPVRKVATIKAQIKANTAMASKALKDANHLNQKIAAVTERVKAPPPVIPHEQIADLLAQSRSEHRRYRHELATGTAAAARAALQAASDLRHQADALDPLGLSPSWEEEGPFKAQHVALLKFYREKLT
jgi:hypothetical protein